MFPCTRRGRARLFIVLTAAHLQTLQCAIVPRFEPISGPRREISKLISIAWLDRHCVLDGAEGGSGAEFINHSCHSNLSVQRMSFRGVAWQSFRHQACEDQQRDRRTHPFRQPQPKRNGHPPVGSTTSRTERFTPPTPGLVRSAWRARRGRNTQPTRRRSSPPMPPQTPAGRVGSLCRACTPAAVSTPAPRLRSISKAPLCGAADLTSAANRHRLPQDAVVF